MARRPESSQAADFKEVMALFISRGVIPSLPDPKLVAAAQAIHKCTYSLILWRFRLGDMPNHSGAFLDEMSSDALQILPQIIMGYYKTTCLLIRGVLENCLRHIYYSDHPVEFVRLNRDKKWYVPTESLLEYTRHHYDFVSTEPKFDSLAQISSLYSVMSESVHGRTVKNLQLHDALANIVFEQASADRLVDIVDKCTQAVNFTLAIYHRDSMRTFEVSDRRFLLRSMPPKARQVWMEHE